VVYKLITFKDKDKYVGLFPEIDHVSSFGSTKEEAKGNTIEAALLYLKDKPLPPNKSMEDIILSISDIISEEDITSFSGIEFE